MKKNRHAKIIELIDKYDIETQEELAYIKAASCWRPASLQNPMDTLIDIFE